MNNYNNNNNNQRKRFQNSRNDNRDNKRSNYGLQGESTYNRWVNKRSEGRNQNRDFDNRDQNRNQGYSNRGGFQNRNNNRDRNRSFGGGRSSFNQQPRQFDDKPIPIVNDEQLTKDLKAAVIEIIKNDSLPIPLGILIHKVIREVKVHRNNAFIEKGNVIWVIHELQRNGIINQNMRGKYYLDYQDFSPIEGSEFEGKFKVSLKGSYGFVQKIENDQKIVYFVHKRNFNNAIDGDMVEAVVLDTSAALRKKPNQSNHQDVKIVKVLSHEKDRYVGEVKVDADVGIVANSFYVLLDNPKIKGKVFLNNPHNLVEGHKVLVQLVNFEADNLKADVIKVLGHKNDVGIDIESIVYDHDIDVDFPALAEKQAGEIDHSFERFENQAVRRKLDDAFVTIDPATSKDFDDAIYVEKHADHYLLKVAIADVTSYVEWSSALDDAAKTRGTSVYLINSVIPMLPHVLSNDLCSLNPNVLRCAVVCQMEFDLEGKMKLDSIDVYPALIKSHRRFSYDEVNTYFKKETDFSTELADVKKSIDNAYELFFLMEKQKEARGYVNFDIPEPKIIVDENNVPVEIKLAERYHAEIMIENCMIAANEAVTHFAAQHKIPFIYRVHERPNIEALEKFSLQVRRLGFTTTTKINEDISPLDIAKWLSDNKNNPYNQLIHIMLLRCMAKAFYSDKNLHHFGLASDHYTHFTSPIRRYPDVIVHRLFWMFKFTPEAFTDAERQRFHNELHDLTNQCSYLEVRAVDTERDVNAYKFAEYMNQFINEQFRGIVTSVNPKGCYVRLDNGIEGYALASQSELDFFEYHDQSESLIGKHKNYKINLGTEVTVKLIATHLDTKSIDFSVEAIIKNP